MPERPGPARSMAAVSGVPGLDVDGEREWFVPAGGRDRRPVRVGDHLDANHPLVRAWPDRFSPSAEPVDCWPVSVLTREAQRRQEAERRRLAPHLGRKATPVCARCGAESGESVILVDAPGALDLNSALAGLDDHDPGSLAERYRITQTILAAARLASSRQRDLAAAEARFRAQHTACPDGTAPLAEPELPATEALTYRLTTVRGNGRPATQPQAR